MLRIGSTFYGVTFLLLLVLVGPVSIIIFFFSPDRVTNLEAILFGIIAFTGNIALLVFTWRQCSSPELPFDDGIKIVAGRSMSGCANITIIYIYPLLYIVFISGLICSCIGLFAGDEFAKNAWKKITLPKKYNMQSTSYSSQNDNVINPSPSIENKNIENDTDRYPCPYCAEMIMKKAIICRFCGRDLPTPHDRGIVKPDQWPMGDETTSNIDVGKGASIFKDDPSGEWVCPRCKRSNFGDSYICSTCGFNLMK